MIKLYFSVVILFCFTTPFIQGSKNSNDVIRSLFKTQVNRVDSGVKRPVRFCQGFEDPAEIDCYMRSDIKPYVCTEPVSFNPCESLQRVDTYHYDHIIHRCVKVNVPACEGQIIRVLTLLQCLIYCHNKDPFALGKSRSMVYKLNQPKPYVPHEKIENERKKIFKIHKNEKTPQLLVKAIENLSVNSESNPTPKAETVIEKTKTIINNANENIDEDIFAKTLNRDSDLANYLINGEPNLLGKKVATLRDPATTNENSSITNSPEVDFPNKPDEKSSEIQNAEVKNINKETMKSEAHNQKSAKKENIEEKKSQSEQTDLVNEEKIEETSLKEEISIEKQRVDNVIIDINQNETELPKARNKSKGKDNSKDDGFYLWDE